MYMYIYTYIYIYVYTHCTELLRGKASRVIGHNTALLCMLKGTHTHTYMYIYIYIYV